MKQPTVFHVIVLVFGKHAKFFPLLIYLCSNYSHISGLCEMFVEFKLPE